MTPTLPQPSRLPLWTRPAATTLGSALVAAAVTALITTATGCASTGDSASSAASASGVLATLGRTPPPATHQETLRHVLSFPGGCVDPVFDPATGGIIATVGGDDGTTMLLRVGGRTNTTLPFTVGTGGNDQTAAVTLDGRQIAFCSEHDGIVDIAVINRITGDVVLQLPLTRSTSAPSWSPDGFTLAIDHVTTGDSRQRISVIDTRSNTPPRFVDLGTHPCWSPDITAPAVIYTKDGPRGLQELWHARFLSDGTIKRARLLRSDGGDITDPTWSPCGLAIVFSMISSASPHAASLWMMPMPSGDPTRLDTPISSATQPMWGSDGWIYFTASDDGHPEIWATRTSIPTFQPPLAIGPPTPQQEHSRPALPRADGKQAGGVREPGRMP